MKGNLLAVLFGKGVNYPVRHPLEVFTDILQQFCFQLSQSLGWFLFSNLIVILGRFQSFYIHFEKTAYSVLCILLAVNQNQCDYPQIDISSSKEALQIICVKGIFLRLQQLALDFAFHTCAVISNMFFSRWRCQIMADVAPCFISVLVL